MVWIQEYLRANKVMMANDTAHNVLTEHGSVISEQSRNQHEYASVSEILHNNRNKGQGFLPAISNLFLLYFRSWRCCATWWSLEHTRVQATTSSSWCLPCYCYWMEGVTCLSKSINVSDSQYMNTPILTDLVFWKSHRTIFVLCIFTAALLYQLTYTTVIWGSWTVLLISLSPMAIVSTYGNRLWNSPPNDVKTGRYSSIIQEQAYIARFAVECTVFVMWSFLFQLLHCCPEKWARQLNIITTLSDFTPVLKQRP